jgi:hypothetical protein
LTTCVMISCRMLSHSHLIILRIEKGKSESRERLMNSIK